ncbi:MAG: hypothetical protein HDR21_04625 [Lachnospiraceae bacterium]|nr:hypothetical protein [Lachnospiraceae bacterium]
MALIEIIDDNNKTTYGIFNTYSFGKPEDEGEGEGVVLEVNYGFGIVVKYLIHPDRREPDINTIKSSISDIFNKILPNPNPNLIAYIEEHLNSKFIYIGGEKDEETRKKFTAQKIK